MSQALSKLAEFRTIVRRKAGYLSAVLYGLVPYLHEGYGTIGVTQQLVLIVDPVWILQFTPQEGAFLLMHEIGHVIRATAQRVGNRDKRLFNWAADIPDNDDLIAAGWTPPTGNNAPLTSKTFGFKPGLAAEEYYELLWQRQPPKGHDGICHGSCGGIAGNPSDLEAQIDQEVGRAPVEVKAIQKQLMDDLKTFAASGRGTLPQSLQSLLTLDKRASRIPWRRKFANLLRNASGRIQSGGTEFSMRRPAKSSYARGVLRPGLVQNTPVILFIEDTSGSMGLSQLQAARREARSIMSALGVDTVWWMDADAAVAAPPKQISSAALTSMPVHGGGGTDFCPALEAGLKLHPRPDVIVYLTDGDGTAPLQPPPRTIVIWCIVPSYYNRRPAPWGHAVIMRDEEDDGNYPNLADDETNG